MFLQTLLKLGLTSSHGATQVVSINKGRHSYNAKRWPRGSGGLLKPAATATRAEAVAVIARKLDALGLLVKY